MADADVLIALQDAVRRAIAEAANAEIEKQKHRFVCEMGKVKCEMVGKIVNQIQLVARRDFEGGEYIIQIHFGNSDTTPHSNEN